MSNALRGMTADQKRATRAVLDIAAPAQGEGRKRYDGITLLRSPSVLNPPHTIIIRKRDPDGNLIREWVVCQRRYPKAVLMDGTVIY